MVFNEELKLGIQTETPKLGGLDLMIARLEGIKTHIKEVNDLYHGLDAKPHFARSASDIKAALRPLNVPKDAFTVGNLSKALKLEADKVDEFLTRMGASIKNFDPGTGKFASLTSAAEGISKFTQWRAKNAADATSFFKAAMAPTAQQVTMAGFAAGVSGQVRLEIPASQIQAVVTGAVKVEAGQTPGGGTGPTRDGNGQFTPGAKRTRAPKRKAVGGTAFPAVTPNEISRVFSETAEESTAVVTELTALGETVSKKYDSVEAVLKTVTRQAPASALVKKVRLAKQMELQAIQRAKIDAGKGNFAGLEQVYELGAANLGSLLSGPEAAGLNPKGLGHVAEQLKLSAGIMRAKAADANRRGLEAQKKAAERKAAADFKQLAAEEKAKFETGRSGLQPRDLDGLAGLQEGHATTLMALSGLAPSPELTQELAAAASALKAKAGVNRTQAARVKVKKSEADFLRDLKEKIALHEKQFEGLKASLGGDEKKLGPAHAAQAALLESLFPTSAAGRFPTEFQELKAKASVLRAKGAAFSNSGSKAEAASKMKEHLAEVRRSAEAMEMMLEFNKMMTPKGDHGALAGLYSMHGYHLRSLLPKLPAASFPEQHAAIAHSAAMASAQSVAAQRAAAEAAKRPPVKPPLNPWSAAGMMANASKVASWSIPAFTVASVWGAAGTAAKFVGTNFLETDVNVQKLGQTFRGVGGTTKELAVDVLGLAAAMGRDGQVALESARNWAKLGLTREEVGVAMTTDLRAGKLSGLELGETTSYLTSITDVYRMSVYGLSGALGMMEHSSKNTGVNLGDLMEATAKSAEAANEARISFGELQGMLGASGATRGSSAVAMGAMLRGMLQKMTDPAVQTFLRDGYGIQLKSGTGETKAGGKAFAEMYEKYMKMSADERGLFAKTMAGTGQASRFHSFMNTYVSGQKLAIDAQGDLNAGLTDNSKLLETVQSQWQGIVGEISKMSMLVMHSKIPMSSMGPMNGEGSSLATWLTDFVKYQRAKLTVWNMALQRGLKWANEPGRIMPGLLAFVPLLEMKHRNDMKFVEAVDGKPLTARNKLEMDMEVLDKERQRQLQTAQLAETLAQTLGHSKTPGADVEGLFSGKEAVKMKGLLAGGDMAGATAMLTELAARSKAEAAGAMEKEVGMAGQLKGYMGQQIEDLQRQKGSQAEINKLKQDQLDVTQRIAEAGSDKYQGDDYIKKHRELLAYAGKQKYLMDSLAKGQAQFPGGSRLDELLGERMNISAQAGIAKETMDTFGREGTDDGIQMKREWAEKLRELQAQLDVVNSPGRRNVAELMDRRDLARGAATAEIGSFRVGRNETDKLIREEAMLKAERERLMNSGPLTDDGVVYALELQTAQMKTQNDLQTRMTVLRGQERQIVMDTTREFQKSLVMASPGELLRKLTASQIKSKGLKAGEFFAMSPNLRGDVDLLLGGDAGRVNREEQRLMRGRGTPTLEQFHRSRTELMDSDFSQSLRKRLMDPLIEAQKAELELRARTAVEMKGFTGQLSLASEQLGIFTGALGFVISSLKGGASHSDAGFGTPQSRGSAPGVRLPFRLTHAG